MTSLNSSNNEQESICLNFDEVVTKLPRFLLDNDISEFLTQVDMLHKSECHHVTAKLILDYVQRILKGFKEGNLLNLQSFLPEDLNRLPSIASDISCEVAIKVINGENSHNISLSVLKILQNFRWETKAVITIHAYIMAFGDDGLNLCPQSKLPPNIKEIPQAMTDLVNMIRTVMLFDNLPIEFMTSKDLDFKVVRTHFIVAVYRIIRLVVDMAASHIMANSSRYDKFEVTSLSRSNMLKQINDHLITTFDELEKLLGEKVEYEAYLNIKKIVQQNIHGDNMTVLNALISSDDDTPPLCRGALSIVAHVKELEGKYVLLYLLDLDKNMNAEPLHMVKDSTFELWSEYEILFIPIVGRSKRLTHDQNLFFEIAKKFMPWYFVDHPSRVKNAAVRFFRDDWNVRSEPVIVVLDPQGKVVNPNAIFMMTIWLSSSLPLTYRREEMLLKQLSWKLELLVGWIDPTTSDWILQDKYIFIYGGKDIEWIRSFTSTVRYVSQELHVSIEMVYVGMFHNIELVSNVCDFILYEDLSHCLKNYSAISFFWRRIEGMLYLMGKHGKINNYVYQETKKLFDHDNSNEEWAILAKGSKILYRGDGKVVLSTLKDFKKLKEKVTREGFGGAFESHPYEFY